MKKKLIKTNQKLAKRKSNATSVFLSARQETLKYISGIRQSYQAYRELLGDVILEEFESYVFPRAYIQSSAIGHHWLAPHANELAKFREKARWQSGTSIIRELQGIHFKEKPHAPGVEFMVSRLGKLLAGQGASPTALLKIIDEQGYPHIYQASKTVVGKELKAVIEHHHDTMPQIKLANFSAMCILSILTDPQDGKPDNYMVEFAVDEKNVIKELEIIGIDNDIAFVDAVIKKHENGSKQGQYFINVKNVLYFFPQMEQFIEPTFKKQFLKIEPVLVMAEWLLAILEQNEVYRELLTSGVFSEIEFRGATAGERGMQLPIRLAPKTVKILLHKLYQIKDLLSSAQPMTHWQLLEQIQPAVAKHYSQVRSRYDGNIMKCINALYEEGISDIDELRDYQTELAKGNRQVMTVSVLKTSQQFGFENNRIQEGRDMVTELFESIHYEDYPNPVTSQNIYEYLKKLADKVEMQPLLHWAAQYGLNDLAKWLLNNHLEDTNVANKQGYTALHIAAKCANEELVKLLLLQGANREAKTTLGKTPFMMAQSNDLKKQTAIENIKSYLQSKLDLVNPNVSQDTTQAEFYAQGARGLSGMGLFSPSYCDRFSNHAKNIRKNNAEEFSDNVMQNKQ